MNKALGLIGLSARARKIVYGADSTKEALEKGRVKLLIVSKEASEKTIKNFKFYSEKYNVPICIYGEIEDLSKSIGKKNKAILGILDENLAKEIKKIIPQRDPFLMIDEVEDFIPGESAIAYKNVNIEEWYFKGHFPGNPIMPGVLIAESLAQTGAVAILSVDENKGKNALFGGIDKMRFKRQVVPGDRLKLEVKIIKRKGPIGVGEAIASVDGKVAAKGELTFALI